MEKMFVKTWSDEMWILSRFGKAWHCIFWRTAARIIFRGSWNRKKSWFGVYYWNIFGSCSIFIFGNNDL